VSERVIIVGVTCFDVLGSVVLWWCGWMGGCVMNLLT
jgi:hypothetical protein